MADKAEGRANKPEAAEGGSGSGNFSSLRRKSLTIINKNSVADEKTQLLRQSSLSSQVKRSSSVDKHRIITEKK